MAKERPNSRATRIPRERNAAAVATLSGVTMLSLMALIGISAAAAVFIAGFVGGMILGLGLVGGAWFVSALVHRRHSRPLPIPGRSRTLDCRQARWAPPSSAMGTPHPPTEAQRRVRPCPGTRQT